MFQKRKAENDNNYVAYKNTKLPPHLGVLSVLCSSDFIPFSIRNDVLFCAQDLVFQNFTKS